MALVVEDGSGLPDSDSYVSVSGLKSAWDKLGYDHSRYPDEKVEVAARVSTRFVDRAYRDSFPGYQRRGRDQSLEWPRIAAYVEVSGRGREQSSLSSESYRLESGAGFYYLKEDEVPREILEAVYEAAYRELNKPGTLTPDLKQGGAMIQSAGAGSARVSYFAGSSANTVFQSIDLVLSPLLIRSSPNCGRVSRG